MQKLFLVGDSTLCYYDLAVEDTEFLLPRNGYGMWLQKYFSGIEVVNLALSGRSSKSFLKEDNYLRLKSEMNAGDYLVIAFGHNDQKFKDENRFTYGSGEIADELSYAYHLTLYYINLAFKVGATPILCTSIVRRSAEGKYEGDRVHEIGSVSCYGRTFPPSDYPKTMRKLAKEFSLELVDMTRLTKELYLELGVEQTKKLHATLSFDRDDIDNTHLNSYGAHILARLFIKGLMQTNSPLKEFAVLTDREPSFDEDIIINKKP